MLASVVRLVAVIVVCSDSVAMMVRSRARIAVCSAATVVMSMKVTHAWCYTQIVQQTISCELERSISGWLRISFRYILRRWLRQMQNSNDNEYHTALRVDFYGRRVKERGWKLKAGTEAD
jgi:hypothetical protein